MSRRPSVFVLALTVGDYLLWNWSLNGDHTVIALVAGLTLPPLALVSFWILAVGAMRLVATAVRRTPDAERQLRPAARTKVPSAASARAGEQTAAAIRKDSSRIAA